MSQNPSKQLTQKQGNKTEKFCHKNKVTPHLKLRINNFSKVQHATSYIYSCSFIINLSSNLKDQQHLSWCLAKPQKSNKSHKNYPNIIQQQITDFKPKPKTNSVLNPIYMHIHTQPKRRNFGEINIQLWKHYSCSNCFRKLKIQD